MHINFNGMITGGIAIYFIVKNWLEGMGKILDPVITEAEKAALDGQINKADRKKLVMLAIEELKKAGKIKMSPLTRLVLPLLVDWLANKLPDYNVTKGAKEALVAAKFNGK
jgi:hypothetical protein